MLSDKTMWSLLPLFTSFAFASAFPTSLPSVKSVTTIHQFAKGAWIENLASTSNGTVLVTRLDVPELWLIDPSQPPSSNAQLLFSVPDTLGLTGITEVRPNVFAFLAGNATLTNLEPNPGSYSVWQADFTYSPPAFSKIGDLSDALLPNGATTLSAADGTILLADSILGVVYRFDTTTAEVSVVINDTTFAKPPSGVLGVNGIQYTDGVLYFTNYGAETVGSVPIDSVTGAAIGRFSTTNTTLPNDDLAVRDEIAYVGDEGDGIWRVDLQTKQTTLLSDDQQLVGTTSVRFGRKWGKEDEKVLYASTSSEVNGTVAKGGALVRVVL
ncbi:MAG: hypothetical protein M1820_002631 [Bogoriella megaspora]|nr:MAG: hypothetical protein M1820_002631 [Bogoriella megaspora]